MQWVQNIVIRLSGSSEETELDGLIILILGRATSYTSHSSQDQQCNQETLTINTASNEGSAFLSPGNDETV